MRRAALVGAVFCLLLSGRLLRAAESVQYTSVRLFNQHLYAGSFSSPRGIAFDAAHKELIIADTDNALIGMYNLNGIELFSFKSRHLPSPIAVAVSPDGKEIGAIGENATSVVFFNYRGEYRRELKPKGVDGKATITALAYDADGDLFIAESRSGEILEYGADGALKQEFGSRGADDGQFESVTGIAFDKEGAIYVADARALAVQVFDRQGNFMRGWGKHEMGAENFSLPSGLTVDAEGRVLVADQLRHQVKVFSAEGKLLANFGGLGEGAGQLSFPAGVVVDGENRAYVLERYTNRVQVFEPAAPRQPTTPEGD